MKLRTATCLSFLCLLATQTAPALAAETDEAAAQKAVLAALKDPTSAKFGKFTQVGSDGACLSVYAKNSMTGLVGSQEAVLKKTAGKWTTLYVSDLAGSHQACIDGLSKEQQAAKR